MADPLKTRARRAYERGRLRAAMPWAVPALLGALLSGGGAAVIGLLAAVAVFGLRWRGGALSRGVLPGMLAGGLAWAPPWAWEAAGLGCAGASCSVSCVTACLAGGVAGGVVLATWLGRDRTAWTAGLVVASLLAAMGCLPIGVAGLSGVVALSAVSAPVLLLRAAD